MDKETTESLKDLALSLMGENRVDEGMLIEELLRENERITSEIKKGPVCPVCKTKMFRVYYNGYYDSFAYWSCNCGDDDIPIELQEYGGYS